MCACVCVNSLLFLVQTWADQETRRNTLIANWEHMSSQAKTKLQVPKVVRGWTSKPHIKLRGVPRSQRMIDIINTAWEVKLQQSPVELLEQDMSTDFWCDLSQCISRSPWFTGTLRTLTTSSIIYSFERDLVLTGSDHMRLQGWPDRFLRGTPESDLQQLAGEGTSLPLVWDDGNGDVL